MGCAVGFGLTDAARRGVAWRGVAWRGVACRGAGSGEVLGHSVPLMVSDRVFPSSGSRLIYSAVIITWPVPPVPVM